MSLVSSLERVASSNGAGIGRAGSADSCGAESKNATVAAIPIAVSPMALANTLCAGTFCGDDIIAQFLSAESKRIGVSARIKEPYLKIALRDCALLPDQLIEPLSGHDTHAVGVDVRAMARARRGTVNGNLES